MLGLAGFRIALELPSGAWWAALAERLGHFGVEGAPTTTLSVRLTNPATGAPGGEPRVFQNADGLHLQHDQYHGCVRPDGRTILRVAATPDSLPDPIFAMAVDGLLRLQLAQLLQGVGGLMLHAAGIRGPHELGYVFFGPSGSGKTTMCRLSYPRYAILCDELIAIRLDRASPTLYSTPFAGAWGRSDPGECPLRGLYRLRHAPHTHLSILPRVAAVRDILESLVYYDQSPAGLSQSLEIATQLVQAIPAQELAFQPEESVWQTITAQTPLRAG